MPTTYAHNLFGKMVYQRLPEDIRELILLHQDIYKIGLHGPDILFYVKPFHKNRYNSTAHRLHKEKATGFFERGRELYRATKDEDILVYYLGFICHFVLDSTCHPYISKYMKETGARHDEIETELDRELMLMTGKDPFHYQPASVLRARPRCVRAISQVLEGFKPRDIARSIMGMKFYTKLPICENERKRRIKLAISRGCFLYDYADGRIIREQPKQICKRSTRELKALFREAVPVAADLITEYVRNIQGYDPLNSRFDRNYK